MQASWRPFHRGYQQKETQVWTQGRGLSITTSALYQNFQLQASETLNCLLILIILITLLLKPYLPLHPLNP